ncbi:MAG: hypothetical protein DRH90_21590 [Deltaproteobacteria bacterium]|nr:MAG: hypothetical protein DRH90_21590 [Deltaproteobacteria bacterium]
MIYSKIEPEMFPIKEGESWWVVPLNMKQCEFCAPAGAITICTSHLTVPSTRMVSFSAGVIYQITGTNNTSGYITVKSKEEIVEMPYYVFARYFDAEAFVRGVPSQKEKRRMEAILEGEFNG